MKAKIFTDGACSCNPGPGGWGCFISHEGCEYFYHESEDSTTNNRMEMKAMIHALKYVNENNLEAGEFEIYSDSAYVVNMCKSWIWTWSRNGWRNSKKQIVENCDLVSIIYELLTERDFPLDAIVKVKGHSSNIGNAVADALARNDIFHAQSIWSTQNPKLTKAQAERECNG